ncbi:hypothetical protein AZE42_07063 [Rhizopogon vesiculosus]|uniref:Uncharacterized protein n=1 Tax=Rhizopogon vesiculosus TaxID=180088 RepID=A0A1J8QB79_9AGAM|nr:hypothetical protein AZE42_07063 [Rhizopogon vesiculosus]
MLYWIYGVGESQEEFSRHRGSHSYPIESSLHNLTSHERNVTFFWFALALDIPLLGIATHNALTKYAGVVFLDKLVPTAVLALISTYVEVNKSSTRLPCIQYYGYAISREWLVHRAEQHFSEELPNRNDKRYEYTATEEAYYFICEWADVLDYLDQKCCFTGHTVPPDGWAMESDGDEDDELEDQQRTTQERVTLTKITWNAPQWWLICEITD